MGEGWRREEEHRAWLKTTERDAQCSSRMFVDFCLIRGMKNMQLCCTIYICLYLVYVCVGRGTKETAPELTRAPTWLDYCDLSNDV